uniref:glutathione transferase n=1 Tax=Calcidiscus leptoporus TaxID=127549 RepID=A0A6U5JHR4_9EUKA|mmetsp:Transcript_41754/g.97742  ORF Transcript_41754/g.97742 Transcript_41754/m.97742 type:complete len:228 (+) Transcript_41754:91-774(+)|eukprot:CAMPEP_0119367754 /NCGR_PEP_ID=MMETSP1334-20130426/14497_1 /TAXON_ID=127549 /ORGANISM="Calcidiscus leptoporus, Strain RCC1130" /LENGTH=227 /DNA_ID=CAMNT_0007384233 /DNA_START=545 /DNA_END=1228 /DNA_ORIENTATION=+
MEEATLHYFQILGRGEPIRMTFAACSAKFKEVPIDYQQMKAKAGTEQVPFGQAPMLEVGGVVLSQMSAIMRFIAAQSRPELIGSSALERAAVDMLMCSLDDLYLKYIGCVYGSGLAEDAKANLWSDHFDPESKCQRNSGAHLAYLVNYLERSDSGPFLCGKQLTIADIFFYFTLEAYSREQCFGTDIATTYPLLTAYMKAVSESDGLKERLADPARAQLNFNGNGKG